MNDPVTGGLEIAKGISEYGLLIVLSAFFVVLSLVLWLTVVRRYFKLTDESISAPMKQLIAISNQQNTYLLDIREGLSDKTFFQSKIILETMIRCDIDTTLDMLNQVREENNLNDLTSLQEKIRRLVHNVSNKRYEDLSAFSYKGVKLSSYLEDGWQTRVESLVLKELSLPFNESRTYTNVKILYEDILSKTLNALNYHGCY